MKLKRAFGYGKNNGFPSLNIPMSNLSDSKHFDIYNCYKVLPETIVYYQASKPPYMHINPPANYQAGNLGTQSMVEWLL